ncbi:hypothetical protein H0H93_002924 [Arthromyces matolae]|nr:hypothetical protein H0H93_002924 [Arthromyces matolae]
MHIVAKFSPQWRFLATKDPDSNQISIWNVSSGAKEWTVNYDKSNKIQELEWLQEYPPRLMVLVQDGDRYLEGPYLIVVLDSVSEKTTVIFEHTNLCHLLISFRWKVVGIVTKAQLHLLSLDSESMKELTSLHLSKPESNLPWPSLAHFSPLQPLVVWHGRFYDITDPKCPQLLSTLPFDTQCIAFSPLQPIIAVAFCSSLHVEIVPISCVPLLAASHANSSITFDGNGNPDYQGQLSISQDGSRVLFKKASPKTNPSIMLHVGTTGVTKTSVNVITIPEESLKTTDDVVLLPELPQDIITYCTPGLHEMEAIGLYWRSQLIHSGITGSFCFLTACKDMLVYAILTHENIIISMYSIKKGILAQRIWNLESNDLPPLFWMNMDSSGILTIFIERRAEFPNISDKVFSLEETHHGLVADTDGQIMLYDFNPIPLGFQNLDMLNASYSSQFSALEYPVLVSNNGKWIMNYKGQNILWVPHRLQGQALLDRSWRWCRKRLFIASKDDSLSQDSIMIADFSGVDANVPTPQQVFDKLNMEQIVILGFDKVQDRDKSPGLTQEEEHPFKKVIEALSRRPSYWDKHGRDKGRKEEEQENKE